MAELDDVCWKLRKKNTDIPFIWDYAPEMDYTPALEHDLVSWYQSLNGRIRRMAEIGRVNIITEVSMMASHMAMHRGL